MKGKVAVVTGAGRGVGRAIALALAAEGAHVLVADIDVDAGKAVAEEAARCGVRASFVPTDMGDVSSINAMIESAVSEFGAVHLLANNAGLTRPQQFFEVTEADWDYIQAINAKGAFFCLQSVARHMVAAGEGSIVNTASIAALGYRDTTSVAYSASKGAMLAMTQVAAAALAPHGVRVNAVCPGPTHTEFSVREARLAAGKGDLRDETRRKLFHRLDELVPLGRANTPEDVAEVVLFLLSDRARNTTGSAYVVDGGIMLR
jgi:NAD(P)-dependent dehydrogenase (short-subunit alcohol dehydrogenase family)